jgi:hypothetical protein
MDRLLVSPVARPALLVGPIAQASVVVVPAAELAQQRVPLHLVVERGQHGLDVAAAEAIEHTAHGLVIPRRRHVAPG